MPCDYSLYPSNWKEIRAGILERAGNRCERCGAPNGETVWRAVGGTNWWRDEEPDQCEEYVLVRIVLTVAHLDHDVANNDPDNLRALCQRCHLRWDADQHKRNAARTRRSRKAAGELFGEVVA